MEPLTLREAVTDALRYWERRRLVYNAALFAVVTTYFCLGLPYSRAAATLDLAQGLFILAVPANSAYCAAYPADIFAQMSGFRELWRSYRWVLFLIGVIFAAIITRVIAMGMFRVM